MKLLSLDLSSSNSGYAIFEDSELSEYGAISKNIKGLSNTGKYNTLIKTLSRMSESLVELVEKTNPDVILVEEINTHKNRLGGKTLDGLHMLFLFMLSDARRDQIEYRDSDGATGWRTRLKIKLTAEEKKMNLENKRLNQKLSRKNEKLPIKTRKHVAAQVVNKKFGLTLDVDKNPKDSDVADAIGLGLSYFSK